MEHKEQNEVEAHNHGWRSDEEQEARITGRDPDGEEFDVVAHYRGWNRSDEGPEGEDFRGWRSEEYRAWRDEEGEVEGHGPVMRFTFTDPEVIATLDRVSGLKGHGEADLSDRDIKMTHRDPDGNEVVAHFRSWRSDEESGEVEAHNHSWRSDEGPEAPGDSSSRLA